MYFFNSQNIPPNPNKHLSTFSKTCLLYTSPSPRDGLLSRMPSSAWKKITPSQLCSPVYTAVGRESMRDQPCRGWRWRGRLRGSTGSVEAEPGHQQSGVRAADRARRLRHLQEAHGIDIIVYSLVAPSYLLLYLVHGLLIYSACAIDNRQPQSIYQYEYAPRHHTMIAATLSTILLVLYL